MLFLNIILFSIPEAAIVTLLSTSLLGEKLPWQRYLQIALFTGIIVFCTAYFIGSLIINYLVLIFSVFSGLTLIKIKKPPQRIIAVALAVSTYSLIEFFNITMLIYLFNLDPLVLYDNILLRLASFTPQVLLIILITIYIEKRRFVLFN